MSVGTLDGGPQLVEVHGVGRGLDERAHLLLRHVHVILLELQRAQLLRQVVEFLLLSVHGVAQVALGPYLLDQFLAAALQCLRGKLYLLRTGGKAFLASALGNLLRIGQLHPLARGLLQLLAHLADGLAQFLPPLLPVGGRAVLSHCLGLQHLDTLLHLLAGHAAGFLHLLFGCCLLDGFGSFLF